VTMLGTVAIAGIGLIGGSLGMAIRQRDLARRVVGLARRQATIEEAISLGALDEGSTSPEVVAGADLVILAAPVLAIQEQAEAIGPCLKPGAILTDVGSTKARILESLHRLTPPHVELIGGHPMAGSEQGGVGAARPDLFEGCIYVLTPSPHRPVGRALETLRGLVEALGAHAVIMDEQTHDEAVARISHLPHVVAAALAQSAARGFPADLLAMLAAGGFRSTTRIAASPPELWRDICLTNREAILDALDDFDRTLRHFRAAVDAEDGEALIESFTSGRTARDALVPRAAERARGRG
jgi:prephenate dehydrogenase